MKTILFQGDSITDACRSEEYICHMGLGYPAYVAGRLGLECPNDYKFVNRGVSGDRVTDVYARRKEDILAYQPDVMSFLIGVNDVWRMFDHYEGQDGVQTARFTEVYRGILDELLGVKPGVQLILMEPFINRGSATEQEYDAFRACVEEKAAAVKRIAGEYGAVFVPLQAELDRLCQDVPCEHWTVDGVHPTIYFHLHIADCWLAAYKKLK